MYFRFHGRSIRFVPLSLQMFIKIINYIFILSGILNFICFFFSIHVQKTKCFFVAFLPVSKYFQCYSLSAEGFFCAFYEGGCLQGTSPSTELYIACKLKCLISCFHKILRSYSRSMI